MIIIKISNSKWKTYCFNNLIYYIKHKWLTIFNFTSLKIHTFTIYEHWILVIPIHSIYTYFTSDYWRWALVDFEYTLQQILTNKM